MIKKLILAKPIPTFFLLLSACSLGFAYFVQYALKIAPCQLCLYQRIPYAILGVVAFFDLYQGIKHGLYIYLILFAASLFLSLYHAGIEHGIVSETITCAATIKTEGMTLDELKTSILSAPVSCKDVKFRIFGFSMTELNAMMSVAFTTFLFLQIRSQKKR